MRLLALTALFAALVAAAYAGGETAAAASRATATAAGPVTTPGGIRVRVRTLRNRILCGTKTLSGKPYFYCWRVKDGFTIRLGRRGQPSASFSAKNRGLPAGVLRVRALALGDKYRLRPFRCTVKLNYVRCRNGSPHGFDLGPATSYRF